MICEEIINVLDEREQKKKEIMEGLTKEKKIMSELEEKVREVK